MPTYVVSVAQGRLASEQKLKLAKAITASHNEATGAQGFFAQVIFNEIAPGNHFIGGGPLREDQIFVHGHIRAGRSDDRKKVLLNKILDSVIAVTGVERRYVWVYVSEIPPNQMIEYGHELPLPGQEDAWFTALSEAERNYLQSLG